MDTTAKIYIGILGAGVLILFLMSYFSLTGQKILLPTIGNENENDNSNAGSSSAMLVRGAACQQDADCVYALNAYPIQRCVSGNCPPPEEPNQPVPGDPKYEWMDAFRESCVNAEELNNQSLNGEALLIDTRAAACTCSTIDKCGGNQKCLNGKKSCTTHKKQD